MVLPLAPTPLADAYLPVTLRDISQPSYPLNLVLCASCGNVQLQDVVYPENIYLDYLYETTSSLGLVRHFEGYCRDVLQQVKPAKDSLVIDLGSNDGTLLRQFQRRGYRVLGVDPAKEIALRATAAGIETIPDFFTPSLARFVKKRYGQAAIVTANNLYANIDDLAGFTQGVRELLTPDGVFIVETFYLLDVTKHMVFDFMYHEHLSYFSVKPLARFFQSQGMQLIDVTRVPTKGGSIRCTVARTDGPRTVSPSVGNLAALERHIGLHTAHTFTSFTKRIEGAKRKLLNFLDKIEQEGKIIAGYGASASTTTLLYHFDLQRRVSFLLDDYPRKHHTVSPGCHIPVLPSNAIYEKRPDYCIIFAWRYVEAIVKKHEKFLKEGGHFIVPLPKLKII